MDTGTLLDMIIIYLLIVILIINIIILLDNIFIRQRQVVFVF